MPRKPVKRTRKNLTVATKLELIRKLEKGTCVAKLCEEYKVAKQTISGIKKAKPKLMEYAAQYCVDASASKNGQRVPRKHMKTGKDIGLDAVVMKWCVQQRSVGVNVRGVEIMSAANRLAVKMGIPDFKASDGWLWRFRNRHGFYNTTVRGKAGDADTSGVEQFRLKLQKLVQDEGLDNSQVYNADETGFYWRSMPKNSQIRKGEETTRGKKTSKERLSLLVGANATGTHRLKLTVVGKSKAPKALHSIIKDLPVLYFHSNKAWFTSAIFLEWFHKHFVPSVKKFQLEVLKIPPWEVKAVLILGNTPAHPSEEKLVSEDGRIRVMYLPPNTAPIIQPMDQGIISALKRHYTRRYLDEVLAVLEEEGEEQDTHGAKTLTNIKAYTIHSAIYNFAYSWDTLKVSCLANCWKNLMIGTDVQADFEGFEAEDFYRQLQRGGEVGPSLDDVRDWLDEQEAEEGYQVLTDEDIVASVVSTKDQDSSEEEDNMPVKKVKMSTLCTYVDALLDYTTYSMYPESASHYGSLRKLRELIIEEQHREEHQTKFSSFVPRQRAPASPPSGTSGQSSAPVSPQPDTSDIGDKEMWVQSLLAWKPDEEEIHIKEEPDEDQTTENSSIKEENTHDSLNDFHGLNKSQAMIIKEEPTDD